MDIRNLNRTWPGRANGTLTEKTCYAMTELIKKEKIDIAIDLHEAELQYPVISTIVAHDKGQDLAAMASMMISGMEGFNIGMEYSPDALRGLSHREIGDHTDAISLLLEAPEPFLDATRGRTDRKLLLEGKDEFVVKAGKHGLLFEKMDENGWPHRRSCRATLLYHAADFRPLVRGASRPSGSGERRPPILGNHRKGRRILSARSEQSGVQSAFV